MYSCPWTSRRGGTSVLTTKVSVWNYNVFIQKYVYIYIYTYICIYPINLIYIYEYICIYTCIYVCTYEYHSLLREFWQQKWCTHMYVDRRKYMCFEVYVCVHVYLYISIYMSLYIYVNMYIYICRSFCWHALTLHLFLTFCHIHAWLQFKNYLHLSYLK
jgi:hypothetical protein